MDAILKHTACKICALLDAGEVTSVKLIEASLAQIEKYNDKLNAIISTGPRELLLQRAGELDMERQQGRVRGLLHGMPIVLKDAIVTNESLGMPSTVGAAVFRVMKAQKNAPIVDRLLDAGLIIVGKANTTEFCGLKSNNTPVGWSAVGGQTKSPWRRDDLDEKDQPTAAGSSSGSAVAISAGIVPLAIGTETSGSLVYPASVNGLFGMKLGSGSAPLDGVFSLSENFDSVGPLARCPDDLAALTEILEGKPAGSLRTAKSDRLSTGDLEGLSVGVLSSTWGIHESLRESKWATDDVVNVYESAIDKIRSHCARVTYPIDLADADSLKYQDETLVSIAYSEFSGHIKTFLQNYHDHPDITSLEDIIKWNDDHAAEAMPDPYNTQTELIAAAEKHLPPELHASAVQELRQQAGTNGMNAVMVAERVDIILAPSESTLVVYAALAGWPIASIPIGNFKKNGQPLGMFVVAKGGQEDLLLDFMRGWHGVFDGVDQPIL